MYLCIYLCIHIPISESNMELSNFDSEIPMTAALYRQAIQQNLDYLR